MTAAHPEFVSTALLCGAALGGGAGIAVAAAATRRHLGPGRRGRWWRDGRRDVRRGQDAAGPGGQDPRRTAPPAGAVGWVPDPPTALGTAPPPTASSDARRTMDTGAVVTVRPGDCLWDVAARHLGPDATTAEIAEAWPRWLRANRDVLGDDPDDLHVGQRLRVPEGVTR